MLEKVSCVPWWHIHNFFNGDKIVHDIFTEQKIFKLLQNSQFHNKKNQNI